MTQHAPVDTLLTDSELALLASAAESTNDDLYWETTVIDALANLRFSRERAGRFDNDR
jgi:hypothetical protein